MDNPPKALARRPRILIAEDEEALRYIFEYALSAAGYSVTGVGDGRQAMNLLRQEQTDLLIMDVCLPELDGMQILMQMRAEGLKTPVIAVSGGLPFVGHAADLLRTVKLLGAAHVMQKPFAPLDLIEAVRKHLPGG